MRTPPVARAFVLQGHAGVPALLGKSGGTDTHSTKQNSELHGRAYIHKSFSLEVPVFMLRGFMAGSYRDGGGAAAVFLGEGER